MNNIELFKTKSACCGCGACLNICPQNAIEMVSDEYGFSYPRVNARLCIGCGLCKRVCHFQCKDKSYANSPLAVYAASGTDTRLAKSSASGGIFAVLAKKILEAGGVVYGCAYSHEGDVISPKHVRIDDAVELFRLQGSKYAQSAAGFAYRQVKQDLLGGKRVLFSGTPCQVDALNGFLPEAIRENLITVDIICHGTPGTTFFESYIREIEKKRGSKITNFIFRDKTDGWGLKAGITFRCGNREVKRPLPVQLSSYYQLFLNSETYRENCYVCPYANRNRTSDITLGDFWGIEHEEPDYLKENGGCLDKQIGVSCILANTQKGESLLSQVGTSIILLSTTYEKVAKENHQLNSPSNHTNVRNIIMNLYKTGGYPAVDHWYYKQLGIKRYIYVIWNCIPRKYQIILKKTLKRM